MPKGSLLRPTVLAAVPLATAVVLLLAVVGVGRHWSPLGGSAQAATATVRIGDNFFCDPSGPQPCSQPHDTTVDVGDTVAWEWGPGGAGTTVPHTTTHCADNFSTCSGPREWDSSPSTTSGTFSHTFGPEDAGTTFLYRCQIHPVQMRGQITVVAPRAPTSTPTPTPFPQPSPQGHPKPSPEAFVQPTPPP